MNFEFLIGDILIPILIFILGFFTGKTVEKRNTSNIKGDGNTVIQDSNIKNK